MSKLHRSWKVIGASALAGSCVLQALWREEDFEFWRQGFPVSFYEFRTWPTQGGEFHPLFFLFDLAVMTLVLAAILRILWRRSSRSVFRRGSSGRRRWR